MFDFLSLPFLLLLLAFSVIVFTGLPIKERFYLLDVFTYFYFGIDIVKGIAAVVSYFQIRRYGYCKTLRTYFNIRWMCWLAHLLCFTFGNIAICTQIENLKGKSDCGLLSSSWVVMFFFLYSPVNFLLIFVVWYAYKVFKRQGP